MPPDQNFAQEDGQADQHDAQNVEQDERTATVLTRFGRETPHIAKPDGRTDSGEDEGTSRRPSFARGDPVRTRCNDHCQNPPRASDTMSAAPITRRLVHRNPRHAKPICGFMRNR